MRAIIAGLAKAMAKPILLASMPMSPDNVLGVDELEAGLVMLERTEKQEFWDENIEAFRQTVVAAICETAEILRSEEMPASWRSQLQRQVKVMQTYVDLANQYLAERDAHVRRRRREELN